MFKNIVVAVDGSKHAERALEVACDIANKYDSGLHLVHAPELDVTAMAVGSGAYAINPSDEDVNKAGQELMSQAAELARKHGRTPVECIIGRGSAANEILDYAKQHNADLIVTGRRGMGNISSLILGSVSQRVSHHAPCACLTVK